MKLIAGTTVRIRKISESPFPAYMSASWLHFTPGQPSSDNESLPVEYELEGALLSDVEIGESMRVRRYLRNGVRADGMFVSSPVSDIRGNEVMTLNSIYRIEIIGGP